MPDPAHPSRSCWCGEKSLFPYSDDFHVCKVCGTLVTSAVINTEDLSVSKDEDELYSKDYWLKRQSDRYGLPPLDQRARLDLPERCVHWLNLLLKRRLPPAKVLEIGCAHGSYVALMRWAGYEASGTEMSPWIVKYAEETFAIPVQAGRIENLDIPAGSLDVIVLNDVIEHLPDPEATLRHCATLLNSSGFFIIQTPEYKEHLTYADVLNTQDPFKNHMDGKNEEHLYLFSRRSTEVLWARLGFGTVTFENPIFPYDLFYTASRAPLPENSSDNIVAALTSRPEGRLVLALLDKAYESNDRWWAMERLKKETPPGTST